jgi:hypothetical protein
MEIISERILFVKNRRHNYDCRGKFKRRVEEGDKHTTMDGRGLVITMTLSPFNNLLDFNTSHSPALPLSSYLNFIRSIPITFHSAHAQTALNTKNIIFL